MVQTPDGLLTFGVETTRNTSSDPVTIDDVQLASGTGMEVLGAKVLFIPVKGAQNLIGARNGWPPRLDERDGDMRTNFKDAPEAAGTTIPARADMDVAFVVGVRAEPGAAAGPLRVTYTDGDDNEHTWTGSTTYRTEPGDGCAE